MSSALHLSKLRLLVFFIRFVRAKLLLSVSYWSPCILHENIFLNCFFKYFTACDFNVHKRCKNNVANNCGINARQLADILNDMGMTPSKLNESAKPAKKKVLTNLY